MSSEDLPLPIPILINGEDCCGSKLKYLNIDSGFPNTYTADPTTDNILHVTKAGFSIINLFDTTVALSGIQIIVFNDTVSSISIQPQAGDDLGDGLGVAKVLPAGAQISLVSTGNTRWLVN